jgi:tRNA pseudouridine55 synthase
VTPPIAEPRSPIPDGVLVVDKTEGPTSHDVVKFARRSLGVSGIGHTGTLDPMATGVLPLVIGKATRLAQFLTASDKSYEATIAFGRVTDTCDATGKVTHTSDQRPTLDQLAGAIDGDTAQLDLQVTAGFYVRSLAHDLGEALGCGAHLSALRRTRSGEFGLEHAVPLADVLQSSREALAGRMVPLSALLPDLAAVTLRGAANLERLKNGVEMGPSDLVAPLPVLPPIVRLLGPDGELVGLAKPGKTHGNLHGWVVLA